MRVVEPSFSLNVTQNDGIRMMLEIERQARISHRSEDKQTPDSWKRFIEAFVIGHGDWSVTEHQSITVTVRIDRGVTHELVRHRLFAFTQESTRFVRYGEIDFVFPVVEEEKLPEGFEIDPDWLHCMDVIEQTYGKLLKKGWRPQQARSVLPNALASTIAVTGNLRNWRHFFPDADFKRDAPGLQANYDSDARGIQKDRAVVIRRHRARSETIDNLRKAR